MSVATWREDRSQNTSVRKVSAYRHWPKQGVGSHLKSVGWGVHSIYTDGLAKLGGKKSQKLSTALW